MGKMPFVKKGGPPPTKNPPGAPTPPRAPPAPALSEELSRNVCPLCGPELQPDQLVFPVAEPNGFGMRNLAAPVGNGVNAGKVIMPGVIALAQHA